jgi:endonuclease YncB( thermonuclease family)
MLRRLLVLSTLAGCGFAAAVVVDLDGGSTASAAPVAQPYRGGGIVVRVLDGDTIDVRLASGARERVRVLGIDAPELRPRECHAVQATAAARRLAQGKRVRLIGDRTQAARDRSRRLLAYVVLPNGADLGRQLVAGGFAELFVFDGQPFLRVGAYRTAEKLARDRRLGVWGACGILPIASPPPAPPLAPPTTATTTTGSLPGTTTVSTPTTTSAPPTTTTGTTTETPPPPLGGCHTSYPDFCIPPPPPDKDCSDFTQKNITVRHDVSNPDPHRLDGNKDGKGCEG